MNRGIALPRRADQLPIELTQRNSDIDVMITIAGDSTERRTFGFQSTLKVTRRLIHQNCDSYRPSTTSVDAVLCRSGEDTGNPSRGATCFKCRASQFSASGLFTGEVINGDEPDPIAYATTVEGLIQSLQA